jgi:predicted transposase YbfD/YdcC
MASSALAITHHFATLKDPRIDRRKRHQLLDIVVITLCGVIAGCKTWPQIALFAHKRLDWFATLLALPNGIPSHDTLERVFARLDPVAFAACFRRWTAALAVGLERPHIAIDGKTLRGSAYPGLGLEPLQLVSAWAVENHLSLAQLAVADGSNEITAIPELLELLQLKGALVSIDAIGCQTEIAAKVRERGGDYVLVVKANQETLLKEIQEHGWEVLRNDAASIKHDVFRTEERGHGRHERRTYYVFYDLERISEKERWPGLKVVGFCHSIRTVNGRTTAETRHFIGSRRASARVYGQALRGHWRIENSLHWQLDVTLGEDACRVGPGAAAENLGQLRRFAVGLLKQHPSKQSVACKQVNAMLDTAFLEEILSVSAKMVKV